MKKSAVLSMAVLLFFLFADLASAGLINYKRREKALRTGVAIGGENGESLPQWMKETPRVRNRVERRYDINRDGKLQTAEVKILLRDVIRTVKEKGGMLINSDVLKEYDKDRNGIINTYEVDAIKADVIF